MNPGHALFALRNALNTINLDLAPAGLLLYTHESGGSLSMSEVYDAYGSRHASHLRRASYVLEERKLIRRSADTEKGGPPRRGANVRIELTAKGRKMAEHITAKAEETT